MLNKIKRKLTPFYSTVRKVGNGKRLVRIGFDLLYCKIRFHVSYDEYLKYDFYKHKNSYRKNFVLVYHQKKKYVSINTKKFTQSKYDFYNRIPDLYIREIIRIPDCGVESFVEFAKKHTKFITKPDKGSLGRSIEIFEYTTDLAAIEFFNKSVNDSVICEEFIKQHDELNKLNPFSVNTVRVVSILQDDNVEIISAALKMGAKPDAFVDNMHKGGIGAQLDVDTGVVTTVGRNYNFKEFTHHPISGIQLQGFQVPNWDLIIERVKTAHKRLPQCMLFGWDMAITNDNVDIVEANNAPGPKLMQTMDKIPKGEKLMKLFKKGNPYKENVAE